jgi:hypothetical protein
MSVIFCHIVFLSIGCCLVVTPPISGSSKGESIDFLIFSSHIVSLSTRATILYFATFIPSASAGLLPGLVAMIIFIN